MLGNTSRKYAQATMRRIGVVFWNLEEQLGDFEFTLCSVLVKVTSGAEHVSKEI
jgi:hypothetical protein